MQDFVLLDGGHDTEVVKYVDSDCEGHPLWLSKYLVENPEALRKVCQDFIQAGAEFIMTNTYQATVDGFQKHLGLNREESLALIRNAVTICNDAIQLEKTKEGTKSVAALGVVGPYGAYLHDGSEYAGGNYIDSMTIEEVVEWHRPRFEALFEAGCTNFIFGTLPSLKEAEAFLKLLKQYPGTKVIMCFSAQNEETISHGEKLSDVAERCWELAADQIMAIGVNCLHPRLVEPLLRSVKQRNPNIPLCAKPNTTEIFNTTTRKWEVADNQKSLREYCQDWLNLGVKYISGCCRTTAQDIRDFREEIDKFNSKSE